MHEGKKFVLWPSIIKAANAIDVVTIAVSKLLNFIIQIHCRRILVFPVRDIQEAGSVSNWSWINV